MQNLRSINLEHRFDKAFAESMAASNRLVKTIERSNGQLYHALCESPDGICQPNSDTRRTNHPANKKD